MTLDSIEADWHTNLYIRIEYDGGMAAGGYLYLNEHQARGLRNDLNDALDVEP